MQILFWQRRNWKTAAAGTGIGKEFFKGNGQIQCNNGRRGRNQVLATEQEEDAEAVSESDRQGFFSE